MNKGKIRLVEVGPRDGLQNEKKIISTEDKLIFIKMLIEAGVKNIETTSFVRADKIPQMSDGIEVSKGLANFLTREDLSLFALVPNDVGLNKAHENNLKHIAVFTATSETFNKKNINASIEESLDRIRPVVSGAKAHGMMIRGYVSTVFGCPYEGKTSLDKMMYLIDELFSLGCFEISLGDTIGVGHPDLVYEVIQKIKGHYDLKNIAMHFHDTRAMALANILASLQNGITSFDSSAGGLGGCPYAVGSSGNVGTEDVLNLLHSMGYETGIDMEKLFLASDFILKKIGRDSQSKMHTAYRALRVK
jgi:hydroxymethylglutaryl-CoA lyase